MKFFVVAFLFSTTFAHAALNMKPGLWTVSMQLESDGKKTDPSAHMKAALAKMPEAQKKQMMDMMAKQGAGMSSDGNTQVCYSKQMIEKPENMQKQPTKCDTKVTKNTATEVATSFKCEDGTTGDAKWTVPSPEKMEGLVNVKNPKGKLSKIHYSGKFEKADCGTIKPAM